MLHVQHSRLTSQPSHSHLIPSLSLIRLKAFEISPLAGPDPSTLEKRCVSNLNPCGKAYCFAQSAIRRALQRLRQRRQIPLLQPSATTTPTASLAPVVRSSSRTRTVATSAAMERM